MSSNKQPTTLVALNWLKPEEGGRRRPFRGTTYSTVVDFQNVNHPELLGSAWSVILEFSDTRELNPTEAIMRFLAESAPHEILKPGVEFVLREGDRITLRGKVISVIDSSE